MEYTVVTRRLHLLEKEVNRQIKLGWKPIGGASVWTETVHTKASQAMVKEDT